jgi:hypothetical protein
MKVKGEKRKDREGKRGARTRERITRRIVTIISAIQTKMCREIRLASTIPARNASENHISGSRVVSCSCMRLDMGELAACIVVFHDSIELNG